jgi:hypothetical protein
MDRLDNEDIGLIWARHYPNRSESQSSKSLCITLAMIVKQRAASIFSEGDWADKLQRALAAAGVPREQFESVEAETKFDK